MESLIQAQYAAQAAGLCERPSGATMTAQNGSDQPLRTDDEEHIMELLNLEHFAGCVNETFHAAINDGEVEFILVEARPLAAPANANTSMRAPFSLLFRNTAAFLFPQQSYRMRHDRVGEIGIFLVPIAQEREGFLYQAVFN